MVTSLLIPPLLRGAQRRSNPASAPDLDCVAALAMTRKYRPCRVRRNSFPVEDDLAGLAGDRRGEALLIIGVRQAVGDERIEVQARLEHGRHLVPGLENLAPVNPLDRQ